MSSDHEVRSLKLNKLKKLYEEGNMDLVIPEATKLFQEYSLLLIEFAEMLLAEIDHMGPNQ